jgi:hypothetical protein
MPDTVKIFTNYEFEVNDKFKDLLTPPDAYGLALLEESILIEGVRYAIIVWNGVIIDGRNKYAICKKNNL